jgi:aryl-alcohol dehydrogenase-like predicted oxidoreductase
MEINVDLIDFHFFVLFFCFRNSSQAGHASIAWSLDDSEKKDTTRSQFLKKNVLFYWMRKQLTRIGLGTRRAGSYGGMTRERKVLMEAMSRGLSNVVDTGGWMDTRADHLVSEILEDLFESGRASRDDVALIGHCGELQGVSLERCKNQVIKHQSASSRSSSSLHSDDVVERNAHLWYSIAPASIESTLDECLQNVGIDYFDAFVITSPEHYLEERGRSRFDDAMGAAFRHLDAEVERGRIRCYGVSSTRFAGATDVAMQLDDLVALAGGSANFGVVQFAHNLLESDAVCRRNQRGGAATLAEVAASRGMVRMGYRPLSALPEGSDDPLRLADYARRDDIDLLGMLKEAFDYTIHIERSYPGLDDEHRDAGTLPDYRQLSWAQIIAANQQRLDNLAKWKDVLDMQIGPALDRAMHELSHHRTLLGWIVKYRAATQRLFERYTWLLERYAHDQAQAIREHCKRRDRQAYVSLADYALRYCASEPNVDVTLVGMRTMDHLNCVDRVLSLHDDGDDIVDHCLLSNELRHTLYR